MNVIKNEAGIKSLSLSKWKSKFHTWLWWIMKIDEAFSKCCVVPRVHVQLGCRWGQLGAGRPNMSPAPCAGDF